MQKYFISIFQIQQKVKHYSAELEDWRKKVSGDTPHSKYSKRLHVYTYGQLPMKLNHFAGRKLHFFPLLEDYTVNDVNCIIKKWIGTRIGLDDAILTFI